MGLELTEPKIDTVTIDDVKVINSYILNRSEKDSVYRSYIKKNKKFIKSYKKDLKQLIGTGCPYNPYLRNQLFYCLMNKGTINSSTKKELLIEKCKKDWSYWHRTDFLKSKPENVVDESRIYYSGRYGMPYRVKRRKRNHYVHSKQIAINALTGKMENYNLYKLRPYIFVEIENYFISRNHTIDNDIKTHNIEEKIAQMEISGIEILDKEAIEKLFDQKLETESNLVIYYKKK